MLKAQNPVENVFLNALACKWQSIVNVVAQSSSFDAALIMRIELRDIEVFVSSETPDNPYPRHHRDVCQSNLYCDTVIKSGKPLYVPDASKDPDWALSPDLELGMSCYFGIPINWPDGAPFGTLCILDRTVKEVPTQSAELMQLLRSVFESDLVQLVENLKQVTTLSESKDEAESRYAAVFRQAAVGIARVGLDGTWLEVNDKLCEIFGYSKNELGELSFQDLTHQDDLRPDLELVERLVNGDIPTYTMEKRYLHKKGTIVWAMLTVSLVRDASGQPSYFVSVIEDITAQRDLRRVAEQAQRFEAMGRLVGGIAHEFNNKLASITGNLFLARKNSRDVGRYLDVAEKQCFQAAETVRNLLSYSRNEFAEKGNLDLAKYSSEVLKELHAALPEDVHFDVSIPDEPVSIKGNAAQIQQIILNLITNARDAIADVDHPRITVRLEAVRPADDFVKRHAVMPSDRFGRSDVIDNGVGIAACEQSKIFDPYYTTKPVGVGTGLGLAMVSSLVAQHAGFLEVVSAPGNGATFQVYFPLQDSFVPVPITKKDDRTVAGKGETILVVDDDENLLDVTSDVLSTLGYKVLKATNGVEALDLYRSSDRVDCVLSDLVMPVMGGKELLKHLRDYDPEVKLVFITGYNAQAEVRDSECQMLLKPIDVAQLSTAIKNVIDR